MGELIFASAQELTGLPPDGRTRGGRNTNGVLTAIMLIVLRLTTNSPYPPAPIYIYDQGVNSGAEQPG